jgi:hypothetical protein
MSNIATKAATSTKKFVIKHKTAITVVATSAVWYTINRAAVNQHDDFLKEHDLYEEFYTPSDDE